MQVRDYPYPLINISEVTISGRIVFAEQEAQERGIEAPHSSPLVSGGLKDGVPLYNYTGVNVQSF